MDFSDVTRTRTCRDPGVGTETPRCGWELVRCFAKAQGLVRVDCVLADPDIRGLGEVLLMADNEPAIQALVDAVRGKRGERAMVEKNPKYSYQPNGAVEKC